MAASTSNEHRQPSADPQRLRALAYANRVRAARAELKRAICSGEMTVAAVLRECPDHVRTWTLGELLMAQHRWGQRRMLKLLQRTGLNPTKEIGTLTERQRALLTELLDVAGATPQATRMHASERAYAVEKAFDRD